MKASVTSRYRLVDSVSPVNWAHQLGRGLRSYWGGIAGQGGGDLQDIGPYRNTGTFNGFPYWVGGPYGPSLRFENTAGNEHVVIENSDTSVTDFSVAFWFRSDDVGGTARGIFSWADVAVAANPFLLVQQVGSAVQFLVNGGYNWTPTFVDDVVTWYHVAITLENDKYWSMYVDGGRLSSVYTVPTPPSAAKANALRFYVGSGWSDQFKGDITGVQYYTRTLTSLEVRELYVDNQRMLNYMRQPPRLAGAAGRTGGLIGSGGLIGADGPIIQSGGLVA